MDNKRNAAMATYMLIPASIAAVTTLSEKKGTIKLILLPFTVVFICAFLNLLFDVSFLCC